MTLDSRSLWRLSRSLLWLGLLLEGRGRDGISGDWKALGTYTISLCSLVGSAVSQAAKSQVHLPAQSSRGHRPALTLSLVPCYNGCLCFCCSSCSSSGQLAKRGRASCCWEAGAEAEVAWPWCEWRQGIPRASPGTGPQAGELQLGGAETPILQLLFGHHLTELIYKHALVFSNPEGNIKKWDYLFRMLGLWMLPLPLFHTVFFFFWPHHCSTRDLSASTRDQTHALCSGSRES